MKKIENSFAVTGFIGKDAELRSFGTASMAHSESTVGRLSIHRKKHLQFLKKDEAEK